MKQKKNDLFTILYDQGADVLYLSKGKALATDESSEREDEVVVRKNSKTGEVKGFTIMHFLKRSLGKQSKITLPFSLSFK